MSYSKRVVQQACVAKQACVAQQSFCRTAIPEQRRGTFRRGSDLIDNHTENHRHSFSCGYFIKCRCAAIDCAHWVDVMRAVKRNLAEPEIWALGEGSWLLAPAMVDWQQAPWARHWRSAQGLTTGVQIWLFPQALTSEAQNRDSQPRLTTPAHNPGSQRRLTTTTPNGDPKSLRLRHSTLGKRKALRERPAPLMGPDLRPTSRRWRGRRRLRPRHDQPYPGRRCRS